MRAMIKVAVPLMAALSVAAPSAAKAPALHTSGWAGAGVSSSAAYVTIHNGGRTPDRLVGASSPAASSVSIHDSRNVGGIARMRAAGSLPLAPGAAIAMKPGGLHIMLMGLKAPLRPGAKLPLTLRFEKAGNVQVNLPVLAPGSTGPAENRHGH